MTVEEIIKAVRLCYDEEPLNNADFASASANDNTYMDNIIKSKIGDAVRWICLYSPAELLGGTDEPDSTDREHQTPVSHPTGILVDATDNDLTIISGGGASFTLPVDFIKLARVRVTNESIPSSNWHRAVKQPISEDSEEYLQLYDENGAKATYDRPQAAIIDKATKEMEVWPCTGVTASHTVADTVNYTYVADVDLSDSMFETNAGTQQVPVWVTHYPIPPRVKTAFIYYLAFLVLSAYEDSRAKNMFEIAKMNIGKSE